PERPGPKPQDAAWGSRFMFIAFDEITTDPAGDRDVVSRIVPEDYAAAVCDDLLAGFRLIEYSPDLFSQVVIFSENLFQLHLQRRPVFLVLRRDGHSLRRVESGGFVFDLPHQPSNPRLSDLPNLVGRVLHDLLKRLAADEFAGIDHCGQVMNEIR